jgi:hypothetical protein
VAASGPRQVTEASHPMALPGVDPLTYPGALFV